MAIGALRVNSQVPAPELVRLRENALSWEVWTTGGEAFGREAPFLDYGAGLSPTWPQKVSCKQSWASNAAPWI